MFEFPILYLYMYEIHQTYEEFYVEDRFISVSTSVLFVEKFHILWERISKIIMST